MGIDRMKVVEVALEQVGYLEKASNSDLDSYEGNPGSGNYTKYARDVDGISGLLNGKKQGYSWCAVFVCWCFVRAYGEDEARRLLCMPKNSLAASCKYARQYFQNAGRFKSTPEIGAQIFFSWGHTGIVVDYNDTTVITVEGNAKSGSKEGVWKKSYSRNNANILGYGCPDFDASYGDADDKNSQGEAGGGVTGATDATDALILPVISNGAKSTSVRSMQILLEGNGCSCGKYGTDGEYGSDTGKALRDFQREHGLSADGICGKDTWAALLGLN